ncbi:MAG: TIGR04283 family arsenosugar biosynthesis glycosyltransferase [Desulfopila sp.]|jgi:rSAM/selenodomain-associated transferase 2|nr:TIGR04283 family arsenosugar biosynthesis glycosyltransferase [Desulfopila sp.]
MTSTHQPTSSISIIIPTLNEAGNIAALAQNLNGTESEIIIVDGGSEDATVELARHHGFAILHSPPGRGVQNNTGAASASGSILLFLHADTRLPQNFEKLIIAALNSPEHIAGAFRLSIDQGTAAMRFVAFCANLRSSLLKLPYGDQAIFVRKKDFLQLGKYPEIPIMEDYLFIKKAQKSGKIILLQNYVTTSARRWRRLGVLRTTLINQLVVIGYHLNISIERLARLYRS